MNGEPSALDQVVRHWPHGAVSVGGAQVDVGMPNVLVRALNKGIGVPAIDIQNAYDHYRHESFKGGPRRVSTREIGACPPPFDECVMFWRSHLLGQHGCADAQPGRAYDAALITRLPGERDGLRGWLCMVFARESNGGPRTVLSGAFGIVADVRSWATWVSAIVGTDDTPADAQDALLSGVAHLLGERQALALSLAARTLPGWGDDTGKDAAVVLYALAFMGCKNVVLRDRGFTSPPVKWLATGHRRFRYHVLAIDGKSTPGGLRNPRGDGEKRMSLHIVRGHFARYTPEKPLFGKYIGQFWVPQHTRGDEAVGVVHKDYCLDDRSSRRQTPSGTGTP